MLAAPAVAATDRGARARISAEFTPLVLGGSATVGFSLRIDSDARQVPPPLQRVEVDYPQDLGFATSGLGVASCQPEALQTFGERVCPADSHMGSGTAQAVVPFGAGLVREPVHLGVFAAPSEDGYVHLSILAHGREPLAASVLLEGVLLPGRLRVTVPPIMSLPEVPHVSIVSMSARLGGRLVYYEKVHGKMVAYRPRGIGLPRSCPAGGWRVSASVLFEGGARSRAGTSVRCPHGRRG